MFLSNNIAAPGYLQRYSHVYKLSLDAMQANINQNLVNLLHQMCYVFSNTNIPQYVKTCWAVLSLNPSNMFQISEVVQPDGTLRETVSSDTQVLKLQLN